MNEVNEIVFRVTEDRESGGFNASAIGFGIDTQGDSLEELREMIRKSVQCYFVDDTAPGTIRLQILRE